jgi:GAF domain-containing protein/PAS domain-containing protein
VTSSTFDDSRTWLAPVLGLAATLAIAVADVQIQSAVILISLMVVGPLVAATDAHPRWALFVGAVAVGLSVPLGWIDHIGGTTRHVVGTSVNVAGTLLAWRLATVRDRREQALRQAQPTLARASRLTMAMHAGKIGEWWWDAASGKVGWNDQLASLFGITPGEFDGTFDGWLRLVDERDRHMVTTAVQEGLARGESFRFDHRCVWPDGSTHWIEDVGEITFGRDGLATGAVGLGFDVDERHRELDERAHLMQVERRARRRAEYLTRVHGVLSTSLDIDEILERVTNAVVPDLADWCSAVLAIDRPRDAPTIVVAHHDETMRAWAVEVQRQFPYDPDADWGAAKVIRTGQRELINGVADVVTSDDQSGVLHRADVDSVVTVAIVGPLGVLGSLQLIRGHDRPPFTEGSVELIEELAGRCGAALHIAILFDRQATTRAALETLQRVSGGLAAAVTRHDVARAVITNGISGLHASGAALFVDAGERLELIDADGVSTADIGRLEELAWRAVENDSMSDRNGALDPLALGEGVAALVTPLRIRSRSVGALAFVFPADRRFADDEISMMVTLGARCAGALERAALYERERETALVLQRRLLPDVPTVPDWLEVAARYEPAAGGQIGGDWYQLVESGPGRLMAVVGDAVGHGVASAAAMGQLRASIATAVRSDVGLDVALDVVDAFAAQGMDTLGASAAFAWFDQTGNLQYASAGHPPIVIVPAGQPARLLQGGRRPLLGFTTPSITLASAASEPLGSGDMVLMYTDGLIERRDESLDVSLARLVAALEDLRELGPAELCNELIVQLGGSQRDDVAVLAIRRR